MHVKLIDVLKITSENTRIMIVDRWLDSFQESKKIEMDDISDNIKFAGQFSAMTASALMEFLDADLIGVQHVITEENFYVVFVINQFKGLK